MFVSKFIGTFFICNRVVSSGGYTDFCFTNTERHIKFFISQVIINLLKLFNDSTAIEIRMKGSDDLR